MGKYYFTKEQQEILRKNKYIKNVSEKAITYTEEFKVKFLDEYLNGKLPSEILKELGIDPKLLGRSRISGIVQRVKKNNDRLDGQADKRKDNSGRPKTKDLSDAEQIERLKQKSPT